MIKFTAIAAMSVFALSSGAAFAQEGRIFCEQELADTKDMVKTLVMKENALEPAEIDHALDIISVVETECSIDPFEGRLRLRRLEANLQTDAEDMDNTAAAVE